VVSPRLPREPPTNNISDRLEVAVRLPESSGATVAEKIADLPA